MDFFEMFETLGMFEMYLCVVGVFCIINYYFECRIRIRWFFLYMRRDFKGIFRHCLENVPEV